MENLESLLRGELDRPAEYVRASVSDLIVSTKRIRRRRNLTSGLSAAVAVIAVVALAATLVGSGRTVDPANQPHPNASSAMEQIFMREGVPVSGRFLDADHAVLLVARCPRGIEAFDSCTMSLQVTSDGGATFEKRDMPIQPGIFGASLYVFDTRHLVLDRPKTIDVAHLPTPSDMPTAFPGVSGFPTDPAVIESLYPSLFPSGFPTGFGTDMPTDFPSGVITEFPSDFPSEFSTALPSDLPMLDAARWVSGDGGRTWSSVSTAPGSPVTEIPDGAQVINTNPANELGSLTPGGSAAVMTPDGVAHPIANAPKHALGAQTFGSPNNYSGALDGSYFLYVESPNFDTGGLVISRDKGRTWRPVGIGDSGPLAPIGVGGGRLYMSSLDFADPLNAKIYMSADHGFSWAPVELPDRPGPSAAPSPSDLLPPDDGTTVGSGPTAAVVSDGGLLYSDGAHLWKLDANAKTFRRIDGDGVTTYAVAGMGTLTFGIRSDGADRVMLATTTDGISWRRMPLAK